ncbi:MAG TPA: hypothetical protein PLZ82_04240, partial [Smithellaceae bacterium]|nr:hypothetical protein [Smithellaceae bacterium]
MTATPKHTINLRIQKAAFRQIEEVESSDGQKPFYPVLSQSSREECSFIPARFSRITPAQRQQVVCFVNLIIEEGENDRETLASSL